MKEDPAMNADCAFCPYRRLGVGGAWTCVLEKDCTLRQQVFPGVFACVGACGAKYETGGGEVATFGFREGQTCVERCYSGYYVQSGSGSDLESVCVDECAAPRPLASDPPDTTFCAREEPCAGGLYFSAESSGTSGTSGRCVSDCAQTGLKFSDEPTRTCVSACPEGRLRWGRTCFESCPDGAVVFEGRCADRCPAGFSARSADVRASLEDRTCVRGSGQIRGG